MNSRPAAREHWTLDKRINISIVAVLVGQIFIGGVMFERVIDGISSNTEEIEILFKNNRLLETQMDSIRDQVNLQAVQLGRIDENLQDIREDIRRIANYVTGYQRGTE